MSLNPPTPLPGQAVIVWPWRSCFQKVPRKLTNNRGNRQYQAWMASLQSIMTRRRPSARDGESPSDAPDARHMRFPPEAILLRAQHCCHPLHVAKTSQKVSVRHGRLQKMLLCLPERTGSRALQPRPRAASITLGLPSTLFSACERTNSRPRLRSLLLITAHGQAVCEVKPGPGLLY